MANILPFKGVYYNAGTAGDPGKLVTPPYDVISEAEREAFYKASDKNIIRVILGKDLEGDGEKNNRYTRAGGYLADWLEKGILVRDPEPSMYLLEQNYVLEGGTRKTRTGFICLVELDEYRSVLPHEGTLPGPKEDRLRLLRECRANFSPIFAFYSDGSKAAGKIISAKLGEKPFMELGEFMGVRETLWKISAGESIEEIRKIMKDRLLYIADGHHRFATALNYRASMRAANPRHNGKEPYNYTMVYITNMDDGGLSIFPTHRLVKNLKAFGGKVFLERLKEYFNVEECGSRESVMSALKKTPDNRAMGMCLASGGYFVIGLKDREVLSKVIPGRSKAYCGLNVSILHELVMKRILNVSEDTLENIIYTKSPEDVFNGVEEGRYQAGFVMKPISIEELKVVVEAKELMPRKATYFYPKLLSGLVINRMEG